MTMFTSCDTDTCYVVRPSKTKNVLLTSDIAWMNYDMFTVINISNYWVTNMKIKIQLQSL